MKLCKRHSISAMGAKLTRMRDLLMGAFGRPHVTLLRDPISQLVKSLISGRTKDEVSLPAFERLARAYPHWTDMAAAKPEQLETVIADVTYPNVKARQLSQTLRIVQREYPDFSLNLLGACSVSQASTWLVRLPGVGRKVAAATLNFSALHRPAFVIDTHILRALRRSGFVRPKATTQNAYEIVMAAADGWSAMKLSESIL